MPDYITINDAAEILELAPVSVRKLVERGKLKAYKPGHDLLFIRSEVEETAAERDATDRHGPGRPPKKRRKA